MSEPTPIRRVGFGSGLRWLPRGAELLFSGVGPMAGIGALWLLISMLGVIPVVGQIVVALITPLLTAGVLSAYAELAAGGRPKPGALLAALRFPHRARNLLLVGLLGITGSLAAIAVFAAWLGRQLPAERLEAALSSPEALVAALGEASIGGGLLLAAAIMTVVLAAMYFAIPLILFRRQPLLPALIASLRAVLVNWAAFLGLGLAVIAPALGLGLVLALLAGVLGLALGTAGALAGQVLVLITTLLIQILMAGAQFVAFQEVFQPPPAETAGDDERFLA